MHHTNYKQMIESIANETHNKWLSKAKTARINGVELTVLPYGFLSQAVIEVLKSQAIKSITSQIKYIESIDVSGGGSGRRFKEQILSHLLEEKKKIEDEK